MNQRSRRPVHALLLLLAALSAAACGHRMDHEALLAANAQVVDGGGATPQPAEDSTQTDADPSATVTTNAAPAGPESASLGTVVEGGPAAPTGGAKAAATPCSTPGETGPILVGSVGNYSGLGGTSLMPMLRAVQIWVEHTNSSGGLCGRQVKLTVVDDRGDPAQHLAALRDLVGRHVVAFLYNGAALTAAAGREYLESAQVPVIGVDCVAAVEYESPIFFPQCGPPLATVFGLVRTPVQFAGASKIAFLYCAEVSNCEEQRRDASGVAAAAGAKIVYQARVSLVQPDYTSECRQARDAGATVLYAVLEGSGYTRLVDSCHRQGYDPVYSLGSSQLDHLITDRPGVVRAVGTTQVFGPVSSGTPARAEFQSAMRSLYGRPFGAGEPMGWAAGKLFQLVATRAAAAARSISPATLLDALHTVKDETLDGLTVPLTFPRGGPARPAPCWFVTSVERGTWKELNNGAPLCR